MKKINIWFADNFKIRLVRRYERPGIAFAKQLNNPICVEVGTFKGDNTLRILKQLKPRKLYVIDPWTEEDYTDYKDGTVYSCYKEAMKKLDKYIEAGIVEVIRGRSLEELHRIPKVDFIYLDGNHTYDYLKYELPLFWNKLNKGGVMSGHDIGLPEVAKAVSEFVTNNNLSPIYAEPDWFVKK